MHKEVFIFDNLLIIYLLYIFCFHISRIVTSKKSFLFFGLGAFIILFPLTILNLSAFHSLVRQEQWLSTYFSSFPFFSIFQEIALSVPVPGKHGGILLWFVHVTAMLCWFILIIYTLPHYYASRKIPVIFSVMFLFLPGIFFLTPHIHSLIILGVTGSMLQFSGKKTEISFRRGKTLAMYTGLVLLSFVHYVFLAVLCAILLEQCGLYFRNKNRSLLWVCLLLVPLSGSLLFSGFYSPSSQAPLEKLQLFARFILPFPGIVQGGAVFFLLVAAVRKKHSNLTAFLSKYSRFILFPVYFLFFYLLWQTDPWTDFLLIAFFSSFTLLFLCSLYFQGFVADFSIRRLGEIGAVFVFLLVFPLQWYHLSRQFQNFTRHHFSEEVALFLPLSASEPRVYELPLSLEEEILSGSISELPVPAK